jgi:hypothetical protein
MLDQQLAKSLGNVLFLEVQCRHINRHLLDVPGLLPL